MTPLPPHFSHPDSILLTFVFMLGTWSEIYNGTYPTKDVGVPVLPLVY